MYIGLIFVIIGGIFLLSSLGIITVSPDFWEVFWPTVLILLGIYIILASSRYQRAKKHWFWGNFIGDDRGGNKKAKKED